MLFGARAGVRPDDEDVLAEVCHGSAVAEQNDSAGAGVGRGLPQRQCRAGNRLTFALSQR